VDPTEKYQKQLLEQTLSIYRETPISEATQRAYLATPRHRFVPRYREWGTKEWHEVTAENLTEHVPILYADRPLILRGDQEEDENVPSTISQPSFVLRMLDLLQIKPDHRVFELGTGSGWNAALIGQLVGPGGHVQSVEIIPEVAGRASSTLRSLGISNVQVVEGDGAAGYPDAAPYDRAIFTAGTFDLPRHFYEQIREEGLLLVVIKTPGGGDNLFLLRKAGDHFESVESMICGFVQLRGSYEFKDLEPALVERAVPEWNELRSHEISRRRFGGAAKERRFLYGRPWVSVPFLELSSPPFVHSRPPRTTSVTRGNITISVFGTPKIIHCSSQTMTGSSPTATRVLRTGCWKGSAPG
jgi:protein-L-isoaspartate(D-aspartate) O-methyltransferase